MPHASSVYDAEITGSERWFAGLRGRGRTPQTDVLTNRTGFIVLHPVDGVARTSGQGRCTSMAARQCRSFPETVDPRCPFTDIRALSHEFAPGAWVTCTMEGDAFEMEDQRNWSDASYKTYIRPLTGPGPIRCQRGETVRQAVSLHDLRARPPRRRAGSDGPVRIGIGDVIGTTAADRRRRAGTRGGSRARRPATCSRAFAPRWLVCQVDLRKATGRAELERYRALGELTARQSPWRSSPKAASIPKPNCARSPDGARRRA